MLQRFSTIINTYVIPLQILILSFLIINSNIHIPCLPEIQRAFQTSEQMAQLSFIINPFIAILISLPFGILADIYGRKVFLFSSLAVFTAGTLIILGAPNIYLFFLGRFLQSIGDGGAALISGIIIGDYYKSKEYAKIQAVASISLAVAWAGAPLLGERIFMFLGWRGNFAFIFIISLLLLLFLPFWEEKKHPKIRGGKFIDTLIKTKETMGCMLNSAFLNLSLSQAIPLGIFAAFEFMMPFIYKATYGYSVKGASFAFFIFILINVIGSLIYRIFISHMRIKILFFLGAFIFSIYLLMGLIFLNRISEIPEEVSYLIFGLLSFSIPFIYISSTTRIVDSNPHHLGLALSLLTIIRNTITTAIPLFTSMLSKNSFYSFFTITFIFALLSIGILLKTLRKFKSK